MVRRFLRRQRGTDQKSCRALRELSPSLLGSPPYKTASPEDDYAQTNPSKHADRDEPSTEGHHGHDHGEIVWSSVAAVRAITASRIQHARRTHPAKSDDPAGSSQRYRNEQTGKDCGKWNPPRQQIGAFAAEPVARGVRRRVAHCRLGTARRGALLACALGLNRWARHRAVGTEHAAIARLRL